MRLCGGMFASELSLAMKNHTETGLDRATALLKGVVSSSNAFEATVERIGQSIKLGLYGPGDQLPTERQMAELMRVSRTTVRSAIKVLATGGFLVVKRGRGGGTFVADRLPRKREKKSASAAKPASEVADLLDRRFVLECGVAELAAERASKSQVAALRELMQEMSRHADNLEAYRRLDGHFHIALAQATGSPGLTSAMAEMQAGLSDLIALIPRSEEALKHSDEQHARIVTAVARHDGTAARREMKLHIEATARFLRGLLPRD